MEVAPGIHDVPLGLKEKIGSFAPKIYLVAGGRGALIDSAYGDEEAASRLVEYATSVARVEIAYIVITHAHPDHISGATRLRRETGAQVVLHSAEKTDITIDRRVEEGDTIPLGGIELEVVHTPGHNPGHICPYIREAGIMFSGDHVLQHSTTAIHPPWGDMAQYIDSLRKLLDYDIRLMLPSHGPPVREPRRRLEELIQHRLEREQQVIDLLAQGKGTIAELVDSVYPELDSFLHAVAKGQVHAHLIKLENEGRVSSSSSDPSARYSLN